MSWLKTLSLMVILTVLVIMAGALVGGMSGLIIAGVFALVMNFFAYWFSDKMALAMSGAKQVTEQEEPRLHALIAEVAGKASLPKPKVYVMENDSPNAFATGRDPSHAVVAVTTGIRRLLSEGELRGVVAHEMAHVKNRDMLTMSIVAVLAGVITFLGWMAQFTLLFGGMGRRDNNGGGAGAAIGIIGLLVLIIVMPLAAALVRFAISRTREYAADETGARIIQDPNSLASALEKLGGWVRRKPMKASTATEAMAHMYIVNPFNAASEDRASGSSSFVGLFSTHPPIEDRVRRLRSMSRA